MGTIRATTESIVDHSLYECQESFKMACEVTLGTKSKSTGTGHLNLVSSHGFRNKVWTELERVFSEDMFHICKQVCISFVVYLLIIIYFYQIKFLHNSLNELNLQNTEQNVAKDFWIKFGKLLHEETTNVSSAIKQMWEDDYPKLLKLYCELIKKLKYDEFKYE